MQITEKNVSEYKAAVYVRLSKEDSHSLTGVKSESNSISNQKQLIFDFLKSKPEINIVSVRVDDGYTGTHYNRPAFQLMMNDIKAGLVNCVVVKDLSRFGREYIDAGKYIDRLFPFYGVRLIAVNDGIDTITRDPANEFGITIRNLFNDSYCRDISIKTRTSLGVKRRNGEYTGAFVAYGYKRAGKEKNRLEVDEYSASIVQDIFNWKIAGMNPDGIAKRLNEEGILSPIEYKRHSGLNYRSGFQTKEISLWTPIAVRRILTNKLYIGTLIQGVRTTPNYKVKSIRVNQLEDCCVVENNHEPLVTKEKFDLVQRLLLLDTRTSPGETYVFPLAGMLECGDCSSPMVKKLTTVGGRKYPYYICKRNKENHTCSSHRMRAEEIEQAVLVVLQNHIRTVANMERCLEVVDKLPYRKLYMKKAKDRLCQAEEMIERYRRLKILVYEDMKEGVVSKEDYRDITKEYEEKIERAKRAKEQAENEMEKLMDNSSEQQIWTREFTKHRNLTKLTRSVAAELIERVKVYEGKKIEVEFRYAQNYQNLADSLNELYSETKLEVEH